MRPQELCRLTLTEAARLIVTRQLSPVELTEACLERIEALNPLLNAFITVSAEQALQAARQAEAILSRGESGGPLHGIPLAVKDLVDMQGVPTTAGSRILVGHVATEDATVVARWRASGAVILGKLNLHEFALGATSVNPHYGPVRNPWDAERIAGGSSGGSGAAVAASLCLGALGTDTGGSIRIPASLCGIVGLKPTYGRVSRHKVIPLSWSLDHVGPLAKRVEDAALLLAAMAGPDRRDPATADVPVPDYLSALAGGVKGLRLGVSKDHLWQDTDPEVEAAVRRAIAVLAGLGAQVEEVSLPHTDVVGATVNAIMLPEALAYHRPWLRQRPEDYGRDVRLRLQMGALYQAVDYLDAQRTRALIVEAWNGLLHQVDLLATPTTPIAATRIEDSDLSATLSLIRFTNPFNLAGLPAISVPCGFTAEGLPIGLQLVGRPWDEATVLRAAHAYQQATQWHKARPSPLNSVGHGSPPSGDECSL